MEQDQVRQVVSQMDPGHEAPVGENQRTMHAASMFGVVVLTLLLAALFNADSLVRGSESKPYGDDRDFWLGVWRPVQSVSDTLLLDRPRAAVDEVTGHDGGGRPIDLPAVVSGAEASDVPPVVLPAPTSAPSPTPEPTVRPPTTGEPLRMWVGGDSMAGIFGQSLVRMASDTGVVDTELDYQIATGLARPDYFDWPARLKGAVELMNPDVMVVILGSNDTQGLINPEGEVYQPISDGWQAEYRRRVAGTMALIQRPGRLVVWVGLPPMRDGGLSASLAAMNAIYREEAARYASFVYVDSWAVLGDNGQYAAYLPDESGHVELVREPDGVHLTRAGGNLLASEVLRVVEARVPLTIAATGSTNP